MTEPRITSFGKQVLLDGAHFADARTDAAAQAIAIALEWRDLPDRHWPAELRAKVEGILA